MIIHRSHFPVCLILAVAILSACAPTIVSQRPASQTSTSVRERQALNEDDRIRYRESMNQLKVGSYRTAARLLTRLTTSYPRMAGPHVNLALAYYYQGDFDKAAEAANKALDLSPGLPQAHLLLGLLKIRQHEYAAAEKHYRAAIERDGQYANAHYNLALLYDLYYQQPARAVPHYKSYLQLNNQSDTATRDWVKHLESSLKKSS